MNTKVIIRILIEIKRVGNLTLPQHTHRCHPCRADVIKKYNTIKKKIPFLSTLHLSISDSNSSQVKLSYEPFQSATTSNKQVHCASGILCNLDSFQRRSGLNMATVQWCLRVLSLFFAPRGQQLKPNVQHVTGRPMQSARLKPSHA